VNGDGSVPAPPDPAVVRRGLDPTSAQWLAAARDWVEGEIARRLAPGEGGPQPELLREALAYAALGGGKRLRPALLRLICEECGGSAAAALPSAVAIELLHTYSLVHDDLPCMDDDELRRGRPTVHVVYGQDLGVLVGDALLTLSFEVLAEAPRAAEQVAVLARAGGRAGMVGGQVLDLRSDQREAGVQGLQAVHQLKTAALFGAATEMGALCAGLAGEARLHARHYGTALGRCFQAVDDVLDVVGEAQVLGKTPGKDAALRRDSLVSWLGLAGARAEAQRLAERAHAAAERLGFGVEHRARRLVDALLEREA
jgi:farnesyl diphosphate synthase